MKEKKIRSNWVNYFVEFIIVVFGILIAFQLNNYAENKKNQKKINRHFDQIEQECKANKAQLETALRQAQRNNTLIDSAMSLINKSEDFNQVNIISLQLLNTVGANTRKNAYRNLVESGDIQLISNIRLSQSVIDLYEFFEDLSAFDQIAQQLLIQDYYGYLKNNFDLYSGKTKPDEIYTSQLFLNLLMAYKKSGLNQIKKYQSGIKEVNGFMENLDQR